MVDCIGGRRSRCSGGDTTSSRSCHRDTRGSRISSIWGSSSSRNSRHPRGYSSSILKQRKHMFFGSYRSRSASICVCIVFFLTFYDFLWFSLIPIEFLWIPLICNAFHRYKCVSMIFNGFHWLIYWLSWMCIGIQRAFNGFRGFPMIFSVFRWLWMIFIVFQ